MPVSTEHDNRKGNQSQNTDHFPQSVNSSILSLEALQSAIINKYITKTLKA